MKGSCFIGHAAQSEHNIQNEKVAVKKNQAKQGDLNRAILLPKRIYKLPDYLLEKNSPQSDIIKKGNSVKRILF